MFTLTNHPTGTSITRRMRAAFSSRFRRGTRPTALVRRIEAYAPSQPRPLRSRCAVRGSSFCSVAVHGGETGLTLPVIAARGEWDWRNIAEMDWRW